MPPSQPVRCQAVVRGRVQNVGYRAFVLQHAEDLGVGGTVANLPDGSVECLVEGSRPAVDQLLALLGRGPSGARVTGVVVTTMGTTGAPAPHMRVTR